METITFERTGNIRKSLDIGEERALKDTLLKLKAHPAILDLHVDVVGEERAFMLDKKRSFLFSGKVLFILVDVSKTPYARPDKFLIEYLPANYFQAVIPEDTESHGGASFDLADLQKIPRIFRMTMYVAKEWTERFPVEI